MVNMFNVTESLKTLSVTEKIVLCINTIVISLGLYLQYIYLSFFEWRTFIDPYWVKGQTFFWVCSVFHLFLFVFPVAFLAWKTFTGEIVMSQKSKIYLVTTCSLVIPLLVILLWFVLNTLSFIDFTVNPRFL